MESIELKQTSATIQCQCSCLSEARTRRFEHVSMRRLASTQSKYDGPNRSSFCSVENSILSYHRNICQEGRKSGHNPMADRSCQKAMDARRGATKNSRKFTTVLDRWQNDEIYRASQLVHGWTEEYVKYLDYISKIDIIYDAPYNQRNRYEYSLFMRGVESNKQAGPLCQRPDSCQPLTRTRQRSTSYSNELADKTKETHWIPAVQQHLEWLSLNWKTYYSSSSFFNMDRKPNLEEIFILGPSMERMALSCMARQRMARSVTTSTTPESHTDQHKETCAETSERCLNCCQVHLNPVSIRGLAHFSVFFWQFRVQTVAPAMNATGVCTDNTSPYAHTRTFSRCARHMRLHVWAQGPDHSLGW